MAQKLPTSRQKKPRGTAVTRGTKAVARRAKSNDLNEAFAAFTQVAGSLETSYHRLSEESARLRAELAAKNQENDRMRASMACILESLPCGVIAIDASGEVRLANPEARRLVELDSDTLAALRQIENAAGAIQPDPGSRFGGEREITVGDRRLAITCAVRDGFAIFLVREVARTAYVLANELHNPLASLDLFAGLIADSVDEHPETRQWVDHLQSGLRHVSSTVANTLHFQNPPNPRLDTTNLTRLLRETVEFLRPVARQKRMKIELALDSGAVSGALSVRAEPLMLQQAFFNLALNAFRSMTPGGTLNISAARDREQIRVTFADQGCGIALEHLNHVFEPGFSGYAAPGLGLPVARKIAELHGGGISVTSSAVSSSTGAGSQFTVSLPVIESAGENA